MESEANPFVRFNQLYSKVVQPQNPDTSAFVLATATRDGQPSSRVVLLKSFDDRGFVFYTNLKSQKADELQQNPRASLCFYWETVGYQVRVRGNASIVSDTEADAYFATRPRGSQIGAWASHQSAQLSSREELEARVLKYETQFTDQPVPRPPFWSGFLIEPAYFEFWLRQENRLHVRTIYRKQGAAWEKALLYP